MSGHKQQPEDRWVVIQKPHPSPEEAERLIGSILLKRLREEYPDVFGQPASRINSTSAVSVPSQLHMTERG